MGRMKEALLAQAPPVKRSAMRTVVKGDPHDDPTDSKPAKIVRPAKTKSGRPSRFTYALKSFTAEIRDDGWWIAKTWLVSGGERPQWEGPFATNEDACLAIARRLATEIADRHSVMANFHQIKLGQPLYGLKSTTNLNAKKNGKAR